LLLKQQVLWTMTQQIRAQTQQQQLLLLLLCQTVQLGWVLLTCSFLPLIT
jgi:hypothetical protein